MTTKDIRVLYGAKLKEFRKKKPNWREKKKKNCWNISKDGRRRKNSGKRRRKRQKKNWTLCRKS